MTLDLAKSCPSDFNLTQYCLGDSVHKFAHKPALVFLREMGKEEIWTYQEVWDIVSKLAYGFRKLGLPLQSRIMIYMPSSPDYIFAFFAAILAGFIALPSYERLTQEELLFIVEDSKSSLLIVSDPASIPKTLPSFCRVIDSSKLQELKRGPPFPSQPQTKANDPAILVYTSGTTSKPKGVIHAHRMIWGRRPIKKWCLDISSQDTLLHTDTLNFTYTFGVQLLDTLSSGATALVYGGEKKALKWLELIEFYDVTIFASCPSTYDKILENCSKSSYSFPSLRHCLTAGDAIKPITIERWEKQMGIPLYEALGMTEINLFISTGPLVPRKKGSIGKPQEGRKIVILPQEGLPTPLCFGQIGLLAIHSSDPGLMLGYWKRPQEEKECFRGEWFITQDLAMQDEEGYIFYYGRVGTVLNIEADVVSPQEVESAMENYPGVQEIACWAIPDSQGKLILTLFITPHKEQNLDEEDILNYAKKHLADYKCPKRVFFLDHLPRDTRGKLLRRQLPSMIRNPLL